MRLPHRTLAVALCLAGSMAAAGPDAGSEHLRLVDAAEGCAEFWRRAANATSEQQARAFEELLRAPHPTLYTPDVLGLDEPLAKSVSERLAKLPARFRPDPVRVEEVRRTLDADIQDAAVQFRKTFPGFVASRPVSVVCSLGAFDGGTRKVEGASMLLFGPDVIAAIRPRGFNLRPFLEHELFHVHHEALHPDAPDTVGGSLWEEGLATYVSAALNPGATHDEISVPDALIAKSTPRLAELAGRLLAHLEDASSGPVYRQFFYGSTEKDREVPPRSGYVVGWRIAEAAGKTRSLAQLAAMSPAESRALVERGLRELARTNAPDAGAGPKNR
ncbi:MAG TPA: hypothetical protein VFN91_16720 [Myxococcaceae bacterium]|nr:hypothetical protein [Myxococcaceae bacterium]